MDGKFLVDMISFNKLTSTYTFFSRGISGQFMSEYNCVSKSVSQNVLCFKFHCFLLNFAHSARVWFILFDVFNLFFSLFYLIINNEYKSMVFTLKGVYHTQNKKYLNVNAHMVHMVHNFILWNLQLPSNVNEQSMLIRLFLFDFARSYDTLILLL